MSAANREVPGEVLAALMEAAGYMLEHDEEYISDEFAEELRGALVAAESSPELPEPAPLRLPAPLRAVVVAALAGSPDACMVALHEVAEHAGITAPEESESMAEWVARHA